MKSLPIERVLRLRSELNLPPIEPCVDNMMTIIDKLNMWARQIIEFSGGRQGEPGVQGIPGCNFSNDQFGGGNLDDNLDFVTGDGLYTYDCENIEDIKELQQETIFNFYAHKNLVLSNLVRDDLANRIDFYSPDNLFTTPFVTSNITEHKFNILNSDILGNGQHIQLINSKMVIDNKIAACNSGWSIVADYLKPNKETLYIKGNRNSTLNQGLNVSILSDYIELFKSEDKQKLRFFVNNEAATDNDFSSNFVLQPQTAKNEIRIPNRTGWMGVWQDTLHNREEYEFLSPLTDFDIIQIYLKGEETPILRDFPVKINKDESKYRFKRLNNWVLIDYHIKVELKDSGEFTLKNIRFGQNINTLSCYTDNWLPMDAYYFIEESEEVEDTKEFGRMKIFRNGNRFDLSIKKEINLSKERPYIYLDGQCWAYATVDACQLLKITSELDVCEDETP